MTEPLRTCNHIHDTGATCNSVAAKDQKYCGYHLDYRARQLRMAHYRARAERFYLTLPPLESMYAVQSALAQIAEALAADMIDIKRANALLSVLRLMSLNFRHPEKWQTSLYHSDVAAEIDVAKQYGLPRDLDLDTRPEAAFPSTQEAHDGCPTPPSFGGVGLETDNSGLAFRPDSPISPEWLELRDISNTQGDDAAQVRLNQLQRNRARRELRNSRKRYADIAVRLNIKRAAERLAESQLAAKLAEAGIAPVVAAPLGFDAEVAQEMKKSAAFTREIDACLAGQEVKIA